MTRLTCAIVLRGEFGDRLEAWFPDLTAECGRGRTTLRGTVADQAQLRGLLEELFDLGLEVLSVETGGQRVSKGGCAR